MKVLCGLSRWVERSLAVLVEFFKTVPIVAVLPLGILVLGTGLGMKVPLVAFGVTWPLLIQTLYGVKSLDPMVRDTAKVLGMGPVRTFFGVLLPSASPYIATGLRIAAAIALILTVVTELIAGGTGLGVAISTAAVSGVSAYPAMYALILTTGILGVILSYLLMMVERHLLSWHQTYRGAVVE
jgi:ABC-type nitrate/sulfonate/bicarbonate transport system permease component